MDHPYLIVNKLFELIGLGHFAHQHPWVIYSWVVMAFLIGIGALAGKSISLVPGKLQNFFEIAINGMEEFMVETTGEEGRWFFPVIGTLFLYIFLCNLIGLVPGCFPPTASLNTTASCALTVFVFTHYIGIKTHGTSYIKHFMGPVWWMAPLIMIIEIIGHCSRVLSLSFRLFGNITGKEVILVILFSLAGMFLAPLPMMVMGVFVSFVQAFVFFLLSTAYFAGALEHAH